MMHLVVMLKDTINLLDGSVGDLTHWAVGDKHMSSPAAPTAASSV